MGGVGGLWARVAWATTKALYSSNCEMDGTEATGADQQPVPSAMAYSSLKLGRPPAAGSLAPDVSHKDKGASFALESGDPRPAEPPMAGRTLMWC